LLTTRELGRPVVQPVGDAEQAGQVLDPRRVRAAGSSMFSRADNVASRLNPWKTKPTWVRRNSVSSRSLRQDRSVAPMWTRPESNVSRPDRQCSRVDFPDPDGPMMVLKRPDSKSTETESSAVTVAALVP
jgi:hypothetical protein